MPLPIRAAHAPLPLLLLYFAAMMPARHGVIADAAEKAILFAWRSVAAYGTVVTHAWRERKRRCTRIRRDGFIAVMLICALSARPPAARHLRSTQIKHTRVARMPRSSIRTEMPPASCLTRLSTNAGKDAYATACDKGE